jgi:hypothetical protein
VQIVAGKIVAESTQALVHRFAENAPLAEIDWETVYASVPHGYSDYPT